MRPVPSADRFDGSLCFEPLGAQALEAIEITIFGHKPGDATLSAKRRDLGIEYKVSGCVGLADRLHEERWIIGTGVKHDHARRIEQP